MKIQIDTHFKTISVLDDVNCLELFTTLQKLFPNDEWKEFRLVKYTESQLIYSPPIIVDDRWWERENPYPWTTMSVNQFDTDGNENYTYCAAIEENNEVRNADIFVLEIK
jgi:hypothetical protein